MLENNQKPETPVLIRDLGTKYATETSKHRRRYGLYKCCCGSEFEAIIVSVKSGNTLSCGCFQRKQASKANIKHQMSTHPLYNTWQHMMHRTTNPKNKSFKDYGGRGIVVCDRWLDVRNFIEDMYPSYKDGLSIDRIDNNLGYFKNNCRWTTQDIQSQNTRKLRTTNTSGYRGVSFDKRKGKYQATITVNYLHKHLGHYTAPLEAAAAYDRYILENGLEHTINGVYFNANKT